MIGNRNTRSSKPRDPSCNDANYRPVEGGPLSLLWTALLAVHAAMHLLAAGKGFGWVRAPRLKERVEPGAAILWSLAALLLLATAAVLPIRPDVAWPLGLLALLASQIAISTSWRDTRWVTAVNASLALVFAQAALAWGPTSGRADYARAVAAAARTPPGAVLTDADVASLPQPVACYLNRVGAVGRPRPRVFRATWEGRIRDAPDSPWMPFEGEQTNVLPSGTRLFLIHARLFGAPVEALHVFRDGTASMRIRPFSAFTLLEATGPEVTRAETVTLLNDMALFAPGALASQAVTWRTVGRRRAEATYTLGRNTVRAELSFDGQCELVDFTSDDRLREVDGRFEATRWSTPVSGWRDFGGIRAPSRGEARWHTDAGDFTYLEAELVALEHDPAR